MVCMLLFVGPIGNLVIWLFLCQGDYKQCLWDDFSRDSSLHCNEALNDCVHHVPSLVILIEGVDTEEGLHTEGRR